MGGAVGVGLAVAGSSACLMTTSVGSALPVSTRVQQAPCATVVFWVMDSRSYETVAYW
jgi:hypothetical protein